MKIAFIHVKYPAGGAEKVTSDLAEYLSGRGYGVYMFVENLQRNHLSEKDGRNITFVDAAFWEQDSAANGLPRMAEEIDRLGIDIVVVPDYGIHDLSLLRRNTSAKIVFALHSIPLWETRKYFRNATRNAILSGSVKRTVKWLFAKCPHEFFTRRRRRKVEQRYIDDYRNADLFTVLTDDYKQRLIDILGPQTATSANNHIEVFPNWIPPRDYPAAEKKHRAMFIGRLDYASKRVDRLLDIWSKVERRFPDWELCIVGDGDEKASLVRRAHRLNLSNVVFRGYSTNPAALFAEASILCMTSTFEGWPLVVAEAQQAGVVPIVFDVSAGIHEQIAPDGVNGFLVKPFNKKQFARKLAKLMGDSDLRNRMSRNVVARASEYSNEQRLAKWHETFSKLVNRK
jgi:glycosyltransferase involved in cell wall biosynthesis